MANQNCHILFTRLPSFIWCPHFQINIDLSELELDQNYRTWVRLQHKDPPAENGHKKKCVCVCVCVRVPVCVCVYLCVCVSTYTPTYLSLLIIFLPIFSLTLSQLSLSVMTLALSVSKSSCTNKGSYQVPITNHSLN